VVDEVMSARPDFGDYRQGRKKPRDAVSASGAAANDRGAVADHESLPLADQAVSLALAARTLRDAMKDKSYQATPIGTMVRRYIRWKRQEWGATDRTIRDYEAVLARMSVTLADKQLIEVQTEDLRDVIELWAAQSPRTRQKVTSIIKDFWRWADEQGHIAINPAGRIRRPRAEHKVARVLPGEARPRLLGAARHPRDRLGLFCLLALGMRREEVGALRVCDFDAYRGWVIVYGKGRKERRLPVRGLVLAELKLFLATDLGHSIDRPPEPDDYLLYPVDRRTDGKGPEGQTRYRRTGRPKDKPSPQAVHRWWYRILWDAELVPRGQTSGMNMHRARHLFAVEMRRAAGLDAASHALGHSDLSTTLGIYGHRDDSDLEAAMDQYLRFLQDEDQA
jgi:integrase